MMRSRMYPIRIATDLVSWSTGVFAGWQQHIFRLCMCVSVNIFKGAQSMILSATQIIQGSTKNKTRDLNLAKHAPQQFPILFYHFVDDLHLSSQDTYNY